jgi:hypothetical protein
MLTADRPSLDRRLAATLDAGRAPVLLGGCGSGRTAALFRCRERLGRDACQYIDLERIATTPERFFDRIVGSSPFVNAAGTGGALTPRDALQAALTYFDTARTRDGGTATFLLDEVLELRTFESFPGLRSVLRDLVASMGRSPNRFVLTSRYVARAHRLLRDAPARFEVVHVPPLTPLEVRAALPASMGPVDSAHSHDLARDTAALTDGRPMYVRALLDELLEMSRRGGGDPLSALASLLSPGGALAMRCRFCYELRLHRARGYGALKAILDVLSRDEPLTLTEIAQRMHRTPGSTKDYLSWLEDVDLVSVRQKRYTFSDPLLRLWVRLHCQPSPPDDDDLCREVHAYAVARLPVPEAAMVVADSATTADTVPAKGWGIIEID